LLKERLRKKDDQAYSQKYMKTNQVAMKAIQKEMSLEDMIQQEEEEKEQENERELTLQIDEEKEKEACLLKQIKEKELEDQYNIKKKQNELELQNLKKEATNQVIIKRSQLKKKVMDMRKRAQRRAMRLKAQLQSVRLQMNKDMNVLYKDGDMNRCRVALKNKTNRDDYCGMNFPDNFIKYTDCKEDDDFCYFCCETEYGDMHMEKRQECFDALCNKQETLRGKWLWVSNIA